jgi:predicted ATP-binding protein involved in virulence
MKTKSLTLTNHRGFQKLEIQIGDKVTVFTAVNGSGKSAVLRAFDAALFHLLPKLTGKIAVPGTQQSNRIEAMHEN